MQRDPVRIAVSGAGGRIGYALLFRIAAGGLFGADQPVALSLLEGGERLRFLRATQMELEDSAFPLLDSVEIGDEPRAAFAGADWIILLAGRPLRTDERRADLIRENTPIYIAHGRAINEAAPTARILVVASPCNTNALIARQFAPDVPEEHWFGLTRMIRMRATALLAEKAGVPVSQVTRVTAWGNHSESVYVDFHNAFIGDRPAPEVINDADWVREVFDPECVRRDEEIDRLTGGSPAGSTAQAILGSIKSIATPTPFDRRFGAAVASDGSYGVPRGLFFGFPLRTDNGRGWSIIPGLYHDATAQRRLAANIAELEHDAAVAQEVIGRYA